METYTLVKCLIISVSSVIMLFSILGTKQLMNSLHLVHENQRKKLSLHLVLHRALMIFFLFGYLAVLTGFVFEYSMVSDFFVSLIFFFGSIFVFMGLNLQTKLLAEIQNTVHEIIPICCSCKKIRTIDENPRERKSWRAIEEFLSEKTNANLSHGLCPDCFEQEISKLDLAA